MTIDGPAKLVRVYIGESDQWHKQALYNAIVERARKDGMAGVTVVRGIEGYGASSRIRRAAILDLSTDLPIVVEIVDTPEKIASFLPTLEEMVTEGLIMVLNCEVVKYVHSPMT